MKSISIPDKLYNNLENVAIDEKCNVRDVILNNLREIVAEYKTKKDNVKLTESEEELIKKRLKELGYL